MRLFILAAASAVASVSVPATAQEFQSSRILTTLGEPALFASLKESKATWTKTRGSDGKDYYQIAFANGINGAAYFTVCKPEGCMGMTLVADFESPNGKSAADVDAIINKFNLTNSAGKALRTANGVKAQAYIIADHGIAMGNFQLQIVIFENMSKKLSEALYGG